MELSKTYINLIGLFRTNIENCIFMCSGLPFKAENEDEKNVRIYELHIQDTTTNRTKEIVYISIFQISEKLILRYRKRQFDVLSITEQKIELFDTESGLPYFIENINISPAI